MKKDNYIITAIIVLFLFSVWTITIVDTEIDGLNKTVDYLLAENALQSDRITNLEQYQGEQDEIVSRIAIKDRTQDLRMATIHAEILSHTQRFDDLIHEVNTFEDAIISAAPTIQLPTTWNGPKLSSTNGVVIGPSGRETYYNMDMTFCISRMRRKGYSEKEYPYWIRSDGCKMLGKYIMVAANFRIRPLGTILETSRGWAIVVDTGGFVRSYPKGLDIATTW